ncbi:hypothetical protein ACIQ4I_08650 [Rummeliibacillus sp. NPDC094406]|uniref:hypothetical protein n=1 Tax=Rummeliibacillus sp. NPDC094406 TaxID=3364511 RepID=UPI0038151B71
MLEAACFLIIILLTFVTGNVLRKQYKKNTSISCLSMAIAMTKSTLIGILMTTWIHDLVLSTILSIIISILLIIILTYSLPVRIVTEALSSAFMGGMMGAMLGVMINQYMMICILFFMVLYLLSTVVAIVLWNKEEYPTFSKAIPKRILVFLALSVIMLGVSVLVDYENNSEPKQVDMKMHHHSH